MALSEVSATAEVTRGGYRSPERRAPKDQPAASEPPASSATGDSAADAYPLEVAYYAGRFRADLSQLGLPAEPANSPPEPSESQADPALFDFFGNLSVLLLAVRSGDLTRAQAAADALEMEVLVERSAGRSGESASAHMLDDLGRLFGAVQSRDETAARAAAKNLAAELQGATTPPPPASAPPPPASAPPPPASAPPPDPYAETDADAGGAAYDTLAHYFDAEARVV
jgi:hypothetical protein